MLGHSVQTVTETQPLAMPAAATAATPPGPVPLQAELNQLSLTTSAGIPLPLPLQVSGPLCLSELTEGLVVVDDQKEAMMRWIVIVLLTTCCLFMSWTRFLACFPCMSSCPRWEITCQHPCRPLIEAGQYVRIPGEDGRACTGSLSIVTYSASGPVMHKSLTFQGVADCIYLDL